MKILYSLVFILAFLGLSHAALIVPFWQKLEESEPKKLEEPKEPEKPEGPEKPEEPKDPKEPEKPKEPEELNGLTRKFHEFITSPIWKSLSNNEKEVFAEVMAALINPPQFSPFGG